MHSPPVLEVFAELIHIVEEDRIRTATEQSDKGDHIGNLSPQVWFCCLDLPFDVLGLQIAVLHLRMNLQEGLHWCLSSVNTVPGIPGLAEETG